MGVFLVLLQCAAIILGTFVNGLTGFGGAIIFQLLWSLMESLGVEGAGDLRVGLAICFLIGPVQSAYLGPEALRNGEVRWEVIMGLLPGCILATFLGTAAVTLLDQDLLKKCLGLVFFAFACWQITSKLSDMRTRKRAKQQEFLTEVLKSQAAKHTQLPEDVRENEPAEPLPAFLAGASVSAPLSAHLLSESECAWPSEAGSSAHASTDAEMGASALSVDVAESAHPNAPVSVHATQSPVEVEMSAVSPAGDNGQQRAHPRAYVQLVQVEPETSTLSMNGATVRDDAAACCDTALPSASPLDPLAPALLSSPPSWRPVPFWLWLRPWLTQRLFLLSLAVGVASGLLQGMFGTGGPPIMLLFSYIAISKGEIRGTMIWLGVIQMIPRFVSLIVFDIFASEDWPIYLLLPLCTLAGTWFGDLAHGRVDVNAVLLILQFLVLLSAGSLVGVGENGAFGTIMLLAYMVVLLCVAAATLYLTSMHYRFLRERPQWADAWVEREAARKEAKEQATQEANLYGEWHA